MIKEKNKKTLLLGAVVISTLTLSACIGETEETSELEDCYNQCEEWGGDVDMCKENCDASFDENSVWNQTDEEVEEENDASFDSWSEMPSEVPEFTYGDFVAGEQGLSSWIVDFENVSSEDSITEYEKDLENAGWSASYMEITHMLTGSTEGYTISLNFDPDYGTLQIIVREANE